jgi:hypothetical protein
MRTVSRYSRLGHVPCSAGNHSRPGAGQHDYRRDVNFAGIRIRVSGHPTNGSGRCETTTPTVSSFASARMPYAAQLESRGLRRNDEHPDVYIVSRRSFEME